MHAHAHKHMPQFEVWLWIEVSLCSLQGVVLTKQRHYVCMHAGVHHVVQSAAVSCQLLCNQRASTARAAPASYRLTLALRRQGLQAAIRICSAHCACCWKYIFSTETA